MFGMIGRKLYAVVVGWLHRPLCDMGLLRPEADPERQAAAVRDLLGDLPALAGAAVPAVEDRDDGADGAARPAVVKPPRNRNR